MKLADGPVTLEQNGAGKRQGHVRWRDYHHTYPSKQRVCYVHQLLAVAEGADPYEVFSDGEHVTHHIIEVPWLNVGTNLEVIDTGTHSKHHLCEPVSWLAATADADIQEILP